MPRFLGIDYGTKRIGIALSDESLSIAYPHEVVPNNGSIYGRIAKIVKEEKVNKIVIGLPRGLSNMQDTDMTRMVRGFAKELKRSGNEVDFEDEFFTTQEARRGTGNRKKIDASSAALILQSYLSRRDVVQ